VTETETETETKTRRESEREWERLFFSHSTDELLGMKTSERQYNRDLAGEEMGFAQTRSKWAQFLYACPKGWGENSYY